VVMHFLLVVSFVMWQFGLAESLLLCCFHADADCMCGFICQNNSSMSQYDV
jgi:hypothetical protein